MNKSKPTKHAKRTVFGERVINEGGYDRDKKIHILKNYWYIYSDHQRGNCNLDSWSFINFYFRPVKEIVLVQKRLFLVDFAFY